jgi:hypothetical protein
MRFGDNGANPEAIDQLPFHLNFFLNDNPAEWRTGVPAFGAVQYRNVYRGIDLVYHGSTNRLEFDFIVVPGADYKDIRLHFDNVDKARLASNGDLVLETPAGELRYQKPVAYQDYGSRRRPVASRFVLKGRNVAGSRRDRDPYTEHPIRLFMERGSSRPIQKSLGGSNVAGVRKRRCSG